MERKTNMVNWFEIYVEDLERAKKFYETVFEIQLQPVPMPEDWKDFQMIAFPWVENAPNASGALVKAVGVEPGTGGTFVYFTCEDCGIEESKVELAGGKVLQPKFPIGEHGFCSICMDTEGNTFGLHSMK